MSVGAIYGGIKRMASEGLIRGLRSERDGAYPERQIYGIGDEGRMALATLKREALTGIVQRADPFDLAMSRLDLSRLDSLENVVAGRIARLKEMAAEADTHLVSIRQYLSFTEQIVMKHKTAKLRVEVDWHQELLDRLPEIIEAERARPSEAPRPGYSRS